MKKLLIIVLSFSILVGCRYRKGSGNIVTERRNTASFTGLSVGGGFDVEIKSGPPEVLVEADDNIIKFIETIVVGGELKIRLDHINLRNAHLKVYITAPELNSIKSSASAKIEAIDVLKSEKGISLQSSSGSEIKAELEAPEITAHASSGGELNLSGRTRDLNAESSSGSTINAKSLLSEHTIVSASSGASADVHASLTLDASASSGANVTYRGAANVKKSVSSGGEVEKE
ncbi:MAG: head GIN domain-containing protein [Ferruginibacter sp.]